MERGTEDCKNLLSAHDYFRVENEVFRKITIFPCLAAIFH